MNELLFFLHIGALLFFTKWALRISPAALTTLIAIEAILANLFVIKQTTLFGLNATCSDAFAVGIAFGLNLAQEKFGKQIAKQALWISIGSSLFFLAMSALHCLYIPSPLDTTQSAFTLLLSPTFRISAASLLTYFVVQRLDLFLFGKLKGPLALRMGLCLFITQTLDTGLFTLLGLYGIAGALLEIFFVSACIKWILIAISTLFTLPRIKTHVPV